ncbi:MAG TPA: sugar transferase, partial [Nocardioides sp.]|nr:sugar transferase [Nocardioides sp.]
IPLQPGCVDAVDPVAPDRVLPAWSPFELLALVVVWPLAVAISGGYTTIGGSPNAVRPKALLRAGALAGLVAWTAIAISPNLGPDTTAEAARSVLLVVVVAPIASIVIRRTGQLLAVHQAHRVVLVGDAAGLHPLLQEAKRAARSPRSDILPVAVCLAGDQPLCPDAVIGLADDLTIWVGTDNLLEVVREHRADAVVVAPGGSIDHAHLRRWATWLQDNDTELLVSSGMRDVAPSRVAVSAMGGLQVLRVRPAAIAGATHALKNAMDRMAAAFLLFMFAPLLLVLAVMVRRDSTGPALFTQLRVGQDGELFKVFKFRTMCQGADAVVDELADDNESDRAGVLFKMRQDPRITRLGGVLRKYSLDELPQLINVVRGEMSLIGPRPALPSEVDAYAPDVRRRLAVRPGLTGLWQVSGRSDLSWEDTVRLDLQYVDNWSWTLDLKIALKTFRAVLYVDNWSWTLDLKIALKTFRAVLTHQGAY